MTSFPPASSCACLVLPLCLLSDNLEGDERLENNKWEALCLVSHDACFSGESTEPKAEAGCCCLQMLRVNTQNNILQFGWEHFALMAKCAIQLLTDTEVQMH